MAQPYQAESSAISRRNLVLGLGGAAAAIGVLKAPLIASELLPAQQGAGTVNVWDREYWTLESAGIEEWKRQIKTWWWVASDDGTGKRLLLKSVEPLNSAGERPDEVSRAGAFAVTWQPNVATRLVGDRIYALRHPTYGRMQLYISRRSGNNVVAIFN